jgi:DNA-binding response OmpR family regulator
MPYLILSAGRDTELLKQRNAALAAEGYHVASASGSYEIVEKMLNGDFDLVLLCHSIPDDDRRRLARIINSYTPSTPVILISDDDQTQLDSVRAVNCAPEQIMSTVRNSLYPRGFAHAV